MPDQPFHIAIVGGGLGGIALGIALQVRHVPFTLYEGRSSFTEIGAGINFGPSAVRALRLIDPALGEKVFQLATRNPAPNEEVWIRMKYGVASAEHAEGETIVDLRSPPTGSMTLHRQELLKALADDMDPASTRFNKKLVDYQQNEDCVTLKFADGSKETASVLVGCDGIHSQVRSLMFGRDNPISKANFAQDGAYRAVIPIEKVVELLGDEAYQSTVRVGPGAYLIHYPVSGATAVNCGAWTRKQVWEQESWVLPDQKQQFDVEFKGWGAQAQKLLSCFSSETSFWAAFQHTLQPETFHDGRVVLMGDSAHAMLPHQGAGASQAAEDALVFAEMFQLVQQHGGSRKAVEASLTAVEEVRKPRFLQVQRYSSEAMGRWYDFWDQHLEGEALEDWIRVTRKRIAWIHGVDLAAELDKARHSFQELLPSAGET